MYIFIRPGDILSQYGHAVSPLVCPIWFPVCCFWLQYDRVRSVGFVSVICMYLHPHLVVFGLYSARPTFPQIVYHRFVVFGWVCSSRPCVLFPSLFCASCFLKFPLPFLFPHAPPSVYLPPALLAARHVLSVLLGFSAFPVPPIVLTSCLPVCLAY